MALIVEDGTGKTDAESFCTVAFADDYHTKRGGTAWDALTNDNKEIALRRATDYLEQVYRLRWLGYRKLELQALSWPRDEVRRADFTYLNQYSFYPDNQVPVEVQNACASLALKASSGELAPDIARQTQREKVGPLEVEYEKGRVPYVRYRAIDNLLAPFLDAGSSGTFRDVVIR